jgi:hypothetical protein
MMELVNRTGLVQPIMSGAALNFTLRSGARVQVGSQRRLLCIRQRRFHPDLWVITA